MCDYCLQEALMLFTPEITPDKRCTFTFNAQLNEGMNVSLWFVESLCVCFDVSVQRLVSRDPSVLSHVHWIASNSTTTEFNSFPNRDRNVCVLLKLIRWKSTLPSEAPLILEMVYVNVSVWSHCVYLMSRVLVHFASLLI